MSVAPAEWLSLVKSCYCVPCVLFVRGWNLSKPTPHAQQPRAQPTDLLTTRETELLGCLARGLSNQAIADELCLSPHTVKNRQTVLMRRLGVRTRTQAAVFAVELGIAARPAESVIQPKNKMKRWHP